MSPTSGPVDPPICTYVHTYIHTYIHTVLIFFTLEVVRYSNRYVALNPSLRHACNVRGRGRGTRSFLVYVDTEYRLLCIRIYTLQKLLPKVLHRERAKRSHHFSLLLLCRLLIEWLPPLKVPISLFHTVVSVEFPFGSRQYFLPGKALSATAGALSRKTLLATAFVP